MKGTNMSEFIHKDMDLAVLPNTKGKKIEGYRFYEIGGQHYPSITSVLSIRKKEGLQKWRESIGEKVANWEMNRAARRGKSFHTLVEQYLNNETPSIRDVLPLGLFRLAKPYIDKIDNIRLLEKIMVSPKLTIAGQVDCVAEYNDKLSVIDFKTANKERNDEWNKNYYIQTAAYAIMYEELFGTPIEQIVIIMASEDGAGRVFVKNKADYLSHLEEAIKHFYKYYQEKTKDKIQTNNN